MSGAEAPRLPSALATRYVRSVMGFGVAVGFGLAPFLGKVKFLGFDALLNLFSEDLQFPVIPVSAFLMGLIAAAIQFYSGEAISRALIRKLFRNSLIGLLITLLVLLILYIRLVKRVTFVVGGEPELVVIGFTRLQGTCECSDTIDDIECIYRLAMPVAMASCWNRGPSQLALSLSYLLVTGGFGAVIGLLLLQQESSKKQKRRPRKAAARKTPKPEPDQGPS